MVAEGVLHALHSLYVVRHNSDLLTQLGVDRQKLGSFRDGPLDERGIVHVLSRFAERQRDMADGTKRLDGFASMAGESPFSTITPQPPPSDPKIKELLSRGLMKPETLTPAEVKAMTASLVYHLLSQGKT